MLFGHIGVGLAAKAAAPRVPLGALLLSTMAIDTLSGAFGLAGIEAVDAGGAISVPWSHGLFMAGVWSLAGGALAFFLSRDRRIGLVVGLLVFSHWVLDFISHPMGMGQELPPDLPLLFEGSPKVGLGLYNSVAAALITDLGLLAGGIAIYSTRTRAGDRTGKWALWLLVLVVVLLAGMAAVPQLALLATLAFVLLLPLGNWVDRHRVWAADAMVRV
jgi:uncharacterized membrane protein YhaH (DUF805 family)